MATSLSNINENNIYILLQCGNEETGMSHGTYCHPIGFSLNSDTMIECCRKFFQSDEIKTAMVEEETNDKLTETILSNLAHGFGGFYELGEIVERKGSYTVNTAITVCSKTMRNQSCEKLYAVYDIDDWKLLFLFENKNEFLNKFKDEEGIRAAVSAHDFFRIYNSVANLGVCVISRLS